MCTLVYVYYNSRHVYPVVVSVEIYILTLRI
jgi:hypothetical protein